MKQMAMVYYTAMKRLREFDDTASPVETLADLARVKGIGPFVLKNVEKRELTRLGLAPPPDPARVKAKLARREKRKRDKAAAAAAAATATTEVVTTTTSDESTTPIVKSVVVVKKKTRKVVVVQAASTTLTSVKRSSALSDVRRLLDQRLVALFFFSEKKQANKRHLRNENSLFFVSTIGSARENQGPSFSTSKQTDSRGRARSSSWRSSTATAASC